MQTIAFNLNADKENGHTYYFADIHWETVEKGNTIPLTPEEKKDTLTWAMNNWVEGMMKATGGYVTAWDVVNEAIPVVVITVKASILCSQLPMLVQMMPIIISIGKTIWVMKIMFV